MNPPNILLVTCHDLGTHLGCHGVHSVHSPHIDAFAADALRCDRAFCTAPTCSPSRAGIFTGRAPHSAGCLGLTHGAYGWGLNDTERHLAQALADGGYDTALFGIMHEDKQFHRWGYRTVKAFDEVYRPDCDELTGEVEAWLESRKDAAQPFYAHVGYFEPHAPFDFGGVGPDEERGVDVPDWLVDEEPARRELAMFQGAIRKVDAAFGRLMAKLEALGLRGDTLVVFTTDHGIPFPRAKATLYDTGLTTALMLRWPDRGWSGGGSRSGLISNVDLFPTFLEAAGLALPENLHGQSLLSHLDGRTPRHRDRLFAEQTYHGGEIFLDPRRAIRTERHKLIANFTTAAPFEGRGPARARPEIVEPAHLEVEHGRSPCFELYDLEADPGETVNLARDPDSRAILDDLRVRLLDWMRETDDPLLDGLPPPRIYFDTLQALRGQTDPTP